MEFHTLEDYRDKLSGSKVFLRVDTNATLENGYMPMTERMHSALETIRFLCEQGASVILGTHNGRQGETSFVSIPPLFLLLSEKHRDLPSWRCPGNTYDAKMMGLNDETKKLLRQMKPGEVVVLENLRFLANETGKFSREEFANQKFVTDLLECGVQYYVLDGFSVAHRAHLSIVGFPQIPNIAGLSLASELRGATKVCELLGQNKAGEGKVVFLLGGAKIQDYLDLMENALASGTVDRILTGGVLGNACLFAKGCDLGKNNRVPLEKKDSKGRSIADELPRLGEWLEKYPERFVVPVDLAFLTANGERRECAVDAIDDELKENATALDIGSRTAELYRGIVSESSMAYWKGPLGAFDKDPAFAKGSEKILALLRDNSDIYSVMGGGDTGQMLQHLDTKPEQLGYVSLAGGALIEILAGKELPGLAALEESCKKFPL